MENVKITKEQVDNIFRTAKTQEGYIIELYKLVVPNWDKVEFVDGYPRLNKQTALYVADKAVEHDKKYTPQVMAGANWGMNVGWGYTDLPDLPDWEVDMSAVTIVYK